MRPRALDLFCKAGGVSAGLAEAGFDVTGVDIAPQPRYPYRFIQADALTVDLEDYDYIWASPPCQGYTTLRFAPGTVGQPKLIHTVRDRLQGTGVLYTIENVEGARTYMHDPVLLCGEMFGLGAEGCVLRRHRLFESNFDVCPPNHVHSNKPVIGVYGGHARKRSRLAGGRGTRDVWHGGHLGAAKEALGIDWMNLGELSEAIPPVYARFIANQAMHVLS